MNIKNILQFNKENLDSIITANGWVNTCRDQNTICFISLNDGSTVNNLQIVIEYNKENQSEQNLLKLSKLYRGVSLEVSGKVVPSPAKGQEIELKASLNDLTILGELDVDKYPIAKNRYPLEYIRQFPHLKVRTNIGSIVSRIRHACTIATHTFFNNNQFVNVHTPIITSNDCEGAGETFTVTNLKSGDKNDYEHDFFAKQAYLTVSGQLQVESYAHGMSRVYTFGPTFRAENSNTSRHLAEFWMVEPEICFINFNNLMDLGEEYLKFCIEYVLREYRDDIEFINKNICKGHKLKLENIIKNPFKRLSYTEAIKILQKDNSGKKYEKVEEWGIDLSSDHEKFLTEKYGPTILYDYPKEIKSFYMKVNNRSDVNDRDTVQAMDILVPGIGEIIGGSMREDNYNKLKEIMENKGLLENGKLDWYLDLRKFGSVQHGGFGLGFERLIMMITGLSNIKDCIPFPRYPKHCLN